MTTRSDAVLPPARDLRWSEETRLRAIDAAAFWEGRVNRGDLIRRFSISVPQATNDLREYQARAPGNLRYDAKLKTYVTEPDFQPLFGAPDAEAWLAAGEAGVASTMPVATAPMPSRRVDPWVLRQILAARRAGKSLRVLYQPMDEPTASWRWISPAALGGDGIRWHLRAYNHDAGRYEDLLFPRMLELDGERPSGSLRVDADWERIVEVKLRPAARLSPGQRAVIEADYGMSDGVIRLGLVDIENRAEVEAEVTRIAASFRREAAVQS
jgi:hypothetical protein